ncbi:Predicted glucose transporter in beta-glucoside utilization gene cluster [Methylomonas albis]|uniref:L-fucose:H+ symporter permease n=1 Tax=Methylomonas albis TaxID=1854563 RepID=A0ABR9D2G2_9GAMM|nr:L-fucose:H+ symporter permease [Methylomonas albis]MBD9356991.1 L-fucose:H+ symporter permease [Methylomonas albis]CAD6880185.1 Predicted glucose transporter in beta-glucoside utilization gene cluster [Methylomonas albis]
MPDQPNLGRQSYTGSLSILTSLFFIWGFITCLNDILIPHLKAVFTLSYTQAMLIQFCFFTAYFLISVPSGYLVEKIDYKGGIIVGLAIAGCGCSLFYPAAGLHSYPLFLAAFFVLASGITLLQVSANPYVTVLGDPHTASSRLTLTQAFNSLGTTLAPYFGALFILSIAVKSADQIKLLDADQLTAYQAAEAAAVQNPYLLLAALLFLMAAVFALLKLPKINQQAEASGPNEEGDSAWHHAHLVLGAVAIFVYVGGEVSIGSFLVNFLGEPDIAGLAEQDAGKYVSFYWGGAMVGRFIGAAVMQKIHPGKVLAFNALAAAALVLATMLGSGTLAMITILSVGLCNSIMFPTIFSLALTGLGKHSGQGSGILCAAIVGGAILPLLQGAFADHIGIQQAFFIPLCCYLFIAYYGFRCRRL